MIRFGSGFGFVTHPRVVLVLAPLLVELLGQPLRDDARHLPGAFEGRAVGRRALCAHNARGAAAHVGATVAHVGAKVAQVGATVARRQLKGRRQRRGHGEEERWDAHSRRCPGGCKRADSEHLLAFDSYGAHLTCPNLDRFRFVPTVRCLQQQSMQLHK